MASLDAFESSLKEVVLAKRLSASKMTKLTEIALKSMENDTQLVSIMYRTHKSLPPAAKVHSLYAFDALCRAARSQVNKHGLTGDANSDKSNCATFLSKVEGVLEGLFQDMVVSGTPEAKEKSKKILDIWVKANTFPSGVLVRLTGMLKETEKEPNAASIVTSNSRPPRSSGERSATPQDPPAPVTPIVHPVQSTLLALLSQAASAAANPAVPQTAPNIASTSTQQLDHAQFALLQQLAQTAKLKTANAVQGTAPLVPPSRPVNGVFNHPPSQPSFRDDGSYLNRNELRHDRFNGIDNGRGRESYLDDRSSLGSFRGGYRGRGSGDPRGRWDDNRRDDRENFRDRERDPASPPRARRSRSPSPRSPRSRYGGKRDIKPYSPPRRPSMVPIKSSESSRDAESISNVTDVEKDEFGRDIRPQTTMNVDSVSDHNPTQPPAAAADMFVESGPAIPSNQISLPVAASTTSQTPDVNVANSMSSQQGLDMFDIATFDFTATASWEVLGKMWQVTHGYPPSQEELMQFVMSGGMAGAGNVPSQTSAGQGWSDPSWQSSYSDRGRGSNWRGNRGRGLMRGGRGGFGNSRITNEHWAHSNMGSEKDSDAIVLGGGSDGDDDMKTSSETSDKNPPSGNTSGGGGGRMQRVGDGWLFVRDNAQENA